MIIVREGAVLDIRGLEGRLWMRRGVWIGMSFIM